jgi:alpha-D-ribose 1-methylphosphonate 5-triphosphate synthase subunit PhnI
MIVAETLSERMIRSFMEGAESGMVEVRGYGLTASEREEAKLMARALYGNPPSGDTQ